MAIYSSIWTSCSYIVNFNWLRAAVALRPLVFVPKAVNNKRVRMEGTPLINS